MTSPSPSLPVRSALEMYMHLSQRIGELEQRVAKLDGIGLDDEIAPELIDATLDEMLADEFRSDRT